MYGIETIQSLNRKNAEAAAILAKHEAPAQTSPTDAAVREHLAHAQETKDRILNGAKG
jgi:hypothetical protein